MSWIFPIFHPWKVLLHHIWSVSPGEYDPAEIHNAGQLRRHMVRNAKMRRNLTNFSWVDLSLRMRYDDVLDKILMVRLVCVCTWAGRWWASSCTSTACWMLLCRNRWQLRWYFLKSMCWLNTLETSCGSQVIIPMDDDVTVLNRPVETKYYSPPPDHVHAEACPVFQLYSMYNICCILFIVSQPERQHPDYLYFRDTTKAMISSPLSVYSLPICHRKLEFSATNVSIQSGIEI